MPVVTVAEAAALGTQVSPVPDIVEDAAPRYPIITSGLQPSGLLNLEKNVRPTIRDIRAASYRKRSVRNEDKADTVDGDQPRDYQKELFDMAKKQNIIAVMDTGTGKTLVASELIKYHMALEEEARKTEGPTYKKKLALFLVPTVPLVFQQWSYLHHQMDKNIVPVCGELLKNEKEVDWRKFIAENDVICATPSVIVEALKHAFLTLEQICLIVFDEAHNALGDHPYAILMREHYRATEATLRPRILGLTASPVNSDSRALIVIENLERMLHCTAVTIILDDEATARYAARPKPRRLSFPACDKQDDYPAIFSYVEQHEASIYGFDFKKILENADYIMRQLGPWACARSLAAALTNLQKQADKGDIYGTYRFPSGVDAARKRAQFFEEVKRFPLPTRPALPELSPKVRKLIDILESYEEDDSLWGIIFVQRRDTAERLTEIIGSVESLKRIVRVGVLLGHGKKDSADALHTPITMTQQYETLQEFRKGALNLLVATKVAEEGLDIKECKLIVRFDMGKECMNLVNYIQCRGRARAANSKFYVMCEDDNWDQRIHLRNLNHSEKEVRQHLKDHPNRLATTTDLGRDDDEVRTVPYGYKVDQTGAQVTLTSALGLLSHFCSLLEVDPYTRARPEYALTIQPSASEDERYRASVTLPNVVPPSLRITAGNPMRSKKLAFRSAALEAIKKLHSRQFLNHHLEPNRSGDRQRSCSIDPDQAELQAALLALRAQKRDRRWIPIKLPESLARKWVTDDNASTLTVYLNVLEITPIHRTTTACGLGFLTSLPLPVSPLDFSLWPNQTEAKVGVRSSPVPITITAEQFQFAKNYNFFALSMLLKPKLFPIEEEYAFLVIPLVTAEGSPPVDLDRIAAADLIDWETTENVANYDGWKHKWQVYKPEVNELILVDRRQFDRKFTALELCPDKNPFDPVPFADAKFKCAADYYTTIKNREIIKREQPVIRARLVSRKFNMLAAHNIAENDRKGAIRDMDVFLIPQFCRPHPIKQKLYETLLLFPSILYYVELACRAEELRQKIQAPARLPEFITALSAPSSTLRTNYQRYETLGDAFLKIAITLHLYVLYPYRQEGVMTMMAHKMLSNVMLYKVARKKGIDKYIIADKLARKEWRPMLAREQLRKDKNAASNDGETGKQELAVLAGKHPLADKQIADVVEAIIGACVDWNGVKGGALCLHNMYSTNFVCDWKDYTSLLMNERSATMPTEKKVKVDNVQQITSYTFKDPWLLAEALTHPSSHDTTTTNYQRLEFLGDAILDFLAVRYFFNTYQELDPGHLTDLKTAAVNNNFLGCVAANLGLHKHIDRWSAPLDQAIMEYCDRLCIAKEHFDDTAEERQKKLDAINSEFIESKGERNRLQREVESEIQYWMDIEIPKPISDVFEATVGAVFVDSGFDEAVVWKLLRRTWLPWVQEFIQPHMVGRHPYRQLAVYFRAALGCDSWRVPTTYDMNDHLYVARLIVHGEVIASHSGPSRKVARRILAETVLDRLEIEPDVLKEKCSCVRQVEKGVVDENVLEKDELMHGQ